MMLATILAWIVGIEHLGIMVLEIWASPKQQAKAFGLSNDYTQQPEARISMANQGIYNGMLGLLIIATTWLFGGTIQLQVWALLLLFIIVVAFYGGLTVGKKVWIMQLLPAVLAEGAVLAVWLG